MNVFTASRHISIQPSCSRSHLFPILLPNVPSRPSRYTTRLHQSLLIYHRIIQIIIPSLPPTYLSLSTPEYLYSSRRDYLPHPTSQTNVNHRKTHKKAAYSPAHHECPSDGARSLVNEQHTDKVLSECIHQQRKNAPLPTEL